MPDVWIVTGGIGSGKSTIRQTLERLGADTIDADQVGHEVLEPGGGAYEAVAARWPSAVIDGRVDRPALARIVFEDPDALRELESMTHPAIGAEIARRIAASDRDTVVVEISVPVDLVGAGWCRTIVADLADDVRRERLMARGMQEEDIDRRMANQPSRSGWRGRGMWIVSTAGSREDVAEKTGELWRSVITRDG